MARYYCPSCGDTHDEQSVAHELLDTGFERMICLEHGCEVHSRGVLDTDSEMLSIRDELLEARREVERLESQLAELLDADQLWGYDDETRAGIKAGNWN